MGDTKINVVFRGAASIAERISGRVGFEGDYRSLCSVISPTATDGKKVCSYPTGKLDLK